MSDKTSTIPCGCRDYCGDVPEDQDRPGSVCKLKPGRSGGALVDVVLIDEGDGTVIASTGTHLAPASERIQEP